MIIDDATYRALKKEIAEDLNWKINAVIDSRLEAWFETNLVARFDKVIQEELNKIIIVKLK